MPKVFFEKIVSNMGKWIFLNSLFVEYFYKPWNKHTLTIQALKFMKFFTNDCINISRNQILRLSFYYVAMVSGFWDRQAILVYSCLFGRRYTKDASTSGPRVSIKTRLRLPRVLRAYIVNTRRNYFCLCNRKIEDPKSACFQSLREYAACK